jgi:hypothetical protein
MLVLAVWVLTAALAHARTVQATTNADYLGQHELFEVEVVVEAPVAANPFVEPMLTATFTTPAISEHPSVTVHGFCDSADGRRYRLRFCPAIPRQAPRGENRHFLPVQYAFEGAFTDAEGSTPFSGTFHVVESTNPGPVVANPQAPNHFMYAGTGQPYYHLGYTAMFLLDPANDFPAITRTLDHIIDSGFTHVRFALTGRWQRGGMSLGPLPAWETRNGIADYTRFHIEYWHMVDRVIAYLQDRDIVAECYLLGPNQGREHQFDAAAEQHLVRYAASRLAGYSNVWFNLGYEYDHQRTKFHGAAELAALLREYDPFTRQLAAQPHDTFPWERETWPSMIQDQYFGKPLKLNQHVCDLRRARKPYLNIGYTLPEEPGKLYADTVDVLRGHWAIAMAGGYATYSDGTDHAYLNGRIGRGKAPAGLKHLRTLFTALPFWTLMPSNELVAGNALCLSDNADIYLVYLPTTTPASLSVPGTPAAGEGKRDYMVLVWWNPSDGVVNADSVRVLESNGPITLTPPAADWVALVCSQRWYVDNIGALLPPRHE